VERVTAASKTAATQVFYRNLLHVSRWPIFLPRASAALGALFFCVAISASAMTGPGHVKRVLIVHSFGTVAPPFTTHSIAFETELVDKMGERVDLDEVSLDMARYADPTLQEALVEYLQKRQADWQPDLVVPVGSPAGVFVEQYRDRLFPETPILYTGMDRRRLGPDALKKNAAFVGENFDVLGFIEDILQVAPATKNIAVVIGASPVEQYWAAAFRKEFEPFANRINFIWLDDLSLDQMLEKTKALPPDSYILLILLLRDAIGVTHNADEALQRIHAVANAPINGIFQHQLGLGIVGGRLYQAELEGIESARIAVRILHGEPASSFAPKIVEPLSPRYDWRELRRWKIDQRLLPPGSRFFFRSPTLWEQSRGWILTGAAICLAEAVLITALLANLFRRRKAERALVESEARFRTMANTTPVLIWVAGPDKMYTFLNAAWLQFTGVGLEEQLGDGWENAIHPEDAKDALETYRTAFDKREPFVVQYRLRRHDGVYRTMTNEGVPRYDAAGIFLGYTGACLDITDLLQKDVELHEIEERVALAADTAHLGVWEFDPDTKEIWLSDKVRALLQFDPDAPVSYTDFISRVHPDDRAERHELIQKTVQNRSGYETEFRVLLPDGTVRWIAGRARCRSNGNGKSPRLLGVSMDVTKRRQAEELFRAATEASPSGTVLIDQNGQIVLVNAHIEELFGYDRDELLGLPVETLLPQNLKGNELLPRTNFIKAPPGTATMGGTLELMARRKDGTEFPVEMILSPIETPQGLLVLASVIDLSERKAAKEEARYRREQVELLSRTSLLGEMTASVAHELNQPLAAILSNANAGVRFIDGGRLNVEQLRDILTDVAADSERAHDIIARVRSAIKKGDAIRGRINLNDVVRNVAYMMQQDAAAHSCEVRLSLAPRLPVVEGDPTQLRQVLINLVSNAFDAMNDAPAGQREVEITTGHNGDGMVSVDVRDHGSGIPDGAGERLFEHFFTTKSEGLGLGLTIVRSIVEAHGGTIAAENAEGGGARFSFHLPTAVEKTI
jgi:PAS domain S-box-containing protein